MAYFSRSPASKLEKMEVLDVGINFSVLRLWVMHDPSYITVYHYAPA